VRPLHAESFHVSQIKVQLKASEIPLAKGHSDTTSKPRIKTVGSSSIERIFRLPVLNRLAIDAYGTLWVTEPQNQSLFTLNQGLLLF